MDIAPSSEDLADCLESGDTTSCNESSHTVCYTTKLTYISIYWGKRKGAHSAANPGGGGWRLVGVSKREKKALNGVCFIYFIVSQNKGHRTNKNLVSFFFFLKTS